MNTIEHAETKRHELALAIAMRDENLSDEEAQARAELQSLSWVAVRLARSELFEEEIA